MGGLKRLTIDDFIDRALKIHNNKYNYSKVTYINLQTKELWFTTIER